MNSTPLSHHVAGQSDPSHVVYLLEGLRVLLVEDSPDQQRLYATFLQRARADVILECSGESALDFTARSSRTLDAVVMDLEISGMDGIEATRQLRERGFAGAVIAVTAYGSQETRNLWLQAGCDAYLEKPLGAETFVSAVRAHAISRSIPLPSEF